VASLKLFAKPDTRVMPALAATNAAFLPMDAVQEILLCMLANDLCRFRAICQPWRSFFSILTSSPPTLAATLAL
jgi:hypothetical protein